MSDRSPREPNRSYRIVVAATVGAHLAYLAYLPSGGFLAMRWPRTLRLHVPVVMWGIAVVRCGLDCPLTGLERWARGRAGMAPMAAPDFVDSYLAGSVYPAQATGLAQRMAFSAVAVSWVACAIRGSRRVRRSPAGSSTARSRRRTD